MKLIIAIGTLIAGAAAWAARSAEERAESVVVTNERLELGRGMPPAPDVAASLANLLDMTPEQRRYSEEVLRHRDREVKEYQARVRASGVFDGRVYNPRINELRTASYERISGALDRARRDRFADILVQGMLSDAVVFEIEPGMIVRD